MAEPLRTKYLWNLPNEREIPLFIPCSADCFIFLWALRRFRSPKIETNAVDKVDELNSFCLACLFFTQLDCLIWLSSPIEPQKEPKWPIWRDGTFANERPSKGSEWEVKKLLTSPCLSWSIPLLRRLTASASLLNVLPQSAPREIEGQ